MKKKLLLTVFAVLTTLSMVACSGGSSDNNNTADTSPQVSTSVSTSDEKEPESEYYFKDNMLVSADVKIEITDWKVIPVGETGNEYGESPVIAFWYNTTNLSGNENVTPMGSWIAMFTAIQDNDPNQVNELNVGLLPDDAFLDSQMEVIKKDGTAPCAIAYDLDDTTTPVILRATRGFGGENLGEQTFDIVAE